ncbi:PAS domain S-box protein [Methanoplanus sp. FWC-SCC4]|uniref:PAS domain S-box protein n=1 Tax=Methanochimaera problematica TaxID=2609417 RepID=A0AA97FCL6_9EURY|nr:histidine kinase dimerization/phosphoacceptor domain -containing protein [Methanoplanus sp. FWC-SCC4]WOF17020.1 PAS domain S-box protein [Methanoplanus sp. FWC-SCC4]
MFKENGVGQKGGSDEQWVIITLLLTALAFFANYFSYVFEITDTTANIFLIPIIIATFLFQKRGLVYSVFVMGMYLIMVMFLQPGIPALVNAGEHAIIMVGIALIITLLSLALHKSEKKYRLLFETSPAPVIVISPENRVLDANESFFRVFGYPPELILGKRMGELPVLTEESRAVLENYLENKKEARSFKESMDIDLTGEKGEIHNCRVITNTLYDDDGETDVKVAVIMDVTDNVVAEEKIRASLCEKETLLREVHHRVKNNLQVIVSMLKLQSKRTDDPQIRSTLTDCQNRVYSMAMVHEKIYLSDSLADIDIREYLQSLSKMLLLEYSELLGRVSVLVRCDEYIHFDLDTVVPVALITNELISNSLKYAFPGKEEGTISIEVLKTDSMFSYRFRDDGIGMPDGFDIDESQTLGMKIVKTLVRQLNGEINIQKNLGTEIIIRFPVQR